ncbi:hypothetical protein NDI44_24330 [Trichocoleus sp. DQ-A3]|uniref:hypothetical protein n=1 Tax=Cyanophyceae TaxID=3028117 RepID=UPI001685D3A1|nr:hypothetical protein [Coleofasciculus sp. FACHB-125]MBD1902054.1 hypothetical protein [Coleofasciculus sp. FACHB-125]
MYQNRKHEKKYFFFMTSCSLVFCKLFLFSVLISKAQAGGYDEPIPSSIPHSIPTPNSQLPVLSVLNWDKWETPYWLNKSICRESTGNIVCLPAQIALQFGWKIPSSSKSLNPQSNSHL